MLKWLNWIAKIAATALLLSFLSIWTTGYIVNSYMESIIKQLDLPLETQPFALSGVWGKLWGASPPASSNDPQAGEQSPSAGPARQPASSEPPSGEPAASGAAAGADTSPGQDKVEAEAGQPQSSPTGGAVPAIAGNAGILGMTEEQRKTLNDVMAKLNAEQLSKLSAYLEEGLTEAKLEELGQLIKPSLSEREYAKMMELLGARIGKTKADAGPSPADASVQPPDSPAEE